MARIKVRNVLFNILTIVTVLAVGFIGFNLIFGAKGYAVTSNSMAGKLVRGDAVFSRRVSFDELREGDIVTVKVGEKGFFTHRIVDIDVENRSITTKGDANEADDPMPTEEARIVGRMWYSVPFLGYAAIVFDGVSSTKALIVLAIVAVALVAINIIIEKTKKMRGDNNE